ncbi:zinc finger BED domain-containing protein 4-like [Aphis gossypii]|uniref:zinc finger BED domain-containing protein 4-like n=1 Tax=Aphis gossypii TaxID=80765 RepID=UPI002158DFE1|nr:zinc finger BED domain-containing protein 4-like [Aphis gossypii]
MSNLKKHMERKHPLVDLQIYNRPQQEETQTVQHSHDSTGHYMDNNVNIVSLGESTSEVGSTRDIVRPLKRSQLSLHTYVPKKISATDCRPFSMVEDKGFKDFVRMLNPAYSLPSRQSLSKTALPFAYEKCLNDMKSQIKENAVSVCLTTDCWTSINNQSFIAITAHYLDPDFKFISVLLECVPFEESHTSKNLSNKIQSVITDWELDDKVLLVVSDNAYNIKGAITILVGHFKRSSNASHELDKYQQNSGTVPKKIIQDIATRWNSTYYMLCRFIELENAIKATLAILDTNLPTLSPDQWKICKELCLVLKPFEEVTKTVSGENYISSSMVIILYNGLKDVTEKMYSKNFDTHVTQVVLELINGLYKRFSNLENSNTLTICTFLDPRFKQFPLSESIANQTKNKVINATTEKAKKRDKPKDLIMTTTNNIHVENDEFCIWNSFDTTTSKITTQGSNTSKGIIEVNRYVDEDLLLRTGDPLKWWKEYITIQI